MEQAVQAEKLRPPLPPMGVIGWARHNLFNGVFNSILTIVTLFFLWKVVPPVFRWAFIDSAWHTTGQACRQAAGACWSVISMNYRFILFGFYPYEQQWRPFLAMMILFGLAAAYPLGVILALGRRSKMHGVKALCILYIELIRGVPLISLLFMSSIVFPLFLPEGVTFNKILRAQIG